MRSLVTASSVHPVPVREPRRVLVDPRAQVVLEQRDLPLEVGGERVGGGHVVSFCGCGDAPVCADPVRV